MITVFSLSLSLDLLVVAVVVATPHDVGFFFLSDVSDTRECLHMDFIMLAIAGAAAAMAFARMRLIKSRYP